MRYLLFPLTWLLWVIIKVQTLRNAWQIHRMETRYARIKRTWASSAARYTSQLPEHRKAANSP